MAKMNPNAKALWVEALRSGKYKQTTGKLRKGSTEQEYAYCCLGVLCVVAQKNGLEVPDYVLQSQTFPSPDVVKWAGLDSNDPQLTAEDGTSLDAASWNDEKNKSFAEIADMIERSL